MKSTRYLLVNSLVKSFYRQHAAFFVFIFLLLFGVVGVVDGAGIIEFHLSLVRAILTNPLIFLLTLLLWLLYAKKCEQFIITTLGRSEFSFLQLLALIENRTLTGLLVIVQSLLFLPVIIYGLIIFIIGILSHSFWSSAILLTYLIVVTLISVRWYAYHLQGGRIHNEKKRIISQVSIVESSYWKLFIRYILYNKKLLFIGIKIFSCGILWCTLVNQTGTDYELNMILLFYCMAILGHGLLIHQIRDLEETRLTFYRSAPIPMGKRFYQYALFFFILLVPEIITIVLLTPKHLTYAGALLFIGLGYGLLLFLHCLLFIQFFPMKDYLKILLCLFLVTYSSVLTGTTVWFCLLLLLSSFMILRIYYYQFERQVVPG